MILFTIYGNTEFVCFFWTMNKIWLKTQYMLCSQLCPSSKGRHNIQFLEA